MEVTFLGTGGARPTVERNPSAVLVTVNGERVLFDVGEGTTRQMVRFSTGVDVSAVFLTHLHGDHVLGLPGLLRTLDREGRTDPLPVYTPRGTKAHIQELAAVGKVDLGFPVHVSGVGPDDVVDLAGCSVTAFETNHDTWARGYALRHPASEGNPAVVYTGDTRPSETIVEAATGAELLIHDGMFTADHADRARDTRHSTAAEAAAVADRAGVGQLAVTHVSSRYAGDVSPLEREAVEAFGSAAFVADDGRQVALD